MVVDRRVLRSSCAGLMLVLYGAAGAQSTASGSAEVTGLERAQRQAASPMRLILEASRVKRRDAANAGDAGEGTVQPRSASRSASSGPPALDAMPTRAAPAPSGTSTSTSNGGVGVHAIVVLPTDLPTVAASDAAALQAVAPLVAGPSARAVLVLPELAAPAPRATPGGPAPQLVSRVEPLVPEIVLETMRSSEVQVQMLIRADGSVTDVALLPPAPRALLGYVANALERWKYEPLPADRPHQVTLVLHAAH